MEPGSTDIPGTIAAAPPGSTSGLHPTLADPHAALIDRIKQGDAQAFERIVRDLSPRLLAVARRISRSEADAEDAVQEAFLAAVRSIATFDGRAALSTWLHRIVVNAALLRARRARNRPEVPIDSLLPRFQGGMHAERPRGWAATPGDRGPDVDPSTLWNALDALPEQYRDVLLMRDVQGLESKAVAASLGISDALVRQRLHRARQAMLRLLEPAVARTSDGANPTPEAPT